MAETAVRHRPDVSEPWRQRAKDIFVDGVNSPVRAMRSVGVPLLLMRAGQGARVWDDNGNEYVDYLLAFGAMILGHAPSAVQRAIKAAAEHGWHFGVTTPGEVELAEIIREAVPVMERMRFVNSGTEAVMGAIRLARGVTGRNKIVKFDHSYHGHADYLLAKAGSGLATMQIPLSKGVPQDFLKHTISIPYGDYGRVEDVFMRERADIAAVIVEPVGGNSGVVVPDQDFLQYVRDITQEHKALLIFDEVITGFRFGFGAAAELFGIRPELVCLGKIIGGGLPVGAYGGAEAIMKLLAPLGEVYQASTFAGNPLVMAAGKAALMELKSRRAEYERLTSSVRDLQQSFSSAAQEWGVKAELQSFRSMFSIRFDREEMFSGFYRRLLELGILLAPSEYEANFVSFAHTQEEISRTACAMRRVIEALARRG